MMRPNILLYISCCCCSAYCPSKGLLQHTVHPKAHLTHTFAKRPWLSNTVRQSNLALRSAAEFACYSHAAGDPQTLCSTQPTPPIVNSCCLLTAARTTPWKSKDTTSRLQRWCDPGWPTCPCRSFSFDQGAGINICWLSCGTPDACPSFWLTSCTNGTECHLPSPAALSVGQCLSGTGLAPLSAPVCWKRRSFFVCTYICWLILLPVLTSKIAGLALHFLWCWLHSKEDLQAS